MRWWIVELASNIAVAAGFLGLGWTLRGRLRRRQALSIHDDVLQGVVTAKLALELGEVDRGIVALDETLESARSLISGLLDGHGAAARLRPGGLRRGTTTESR
ncbi:MAG TPA: hypothetical protein VM143_12740 [Acidimicrobiales bacterium]|nr:hypothetical protein [Acidimicrobiales bacterium]